MSDTQEPMKAKEADGSLKDEEQQQQQQQQQQQEEEDEQQQKQEQQKQQQQQKFQKQQQQQQQKQEMTVVDLSQYMKPHDSKSAVASFALEEHQRNTADNPGRENTSTMPYLVRRVNSEELLPRPFKSTCQLLCVSYLASLCCVCLSAFAVKHAWQAKEKRNAGVLSRAVKEGKYTCFYLKLSLGFGLAFWSIGVILICVHLTNGL